MYPAGARSSLPSEHGAFLLGLTDLVAHAAAQVLEMLAMGPDTTGEGLKPDLGNNHGEVLL